ncbi:unnamed protein product (mitochondrion) [Plasmodiophora brassicae]|uniref:Glycosyltransferase 61 catalytic domain-containing protein n=1 Tax=Plasmodiophora brassicae TaxID=37360 RepID=A0A0G4IWP7_PLABS|nr:hypothetical protein PBRA_007307 [Plasmodiophora brassicae]SPQ95927.1 unnamed protein product [Plasmodiophora brassicae]
MTGRGAIVQTRRSLRVFVLVIALAGIVCVQLVNHLHVAIPVPYRGQRQARPDPPATTRPARLHSSHICKGDQGQRRGTRHCLLSNVCYDLDVDRLLYFWDGESIPLPVWDRSADLRSGNVSRLGVSHPSDDRLYDAFGAIAPERPRPAGYRTPTGSSCAVLTPHDDDARRYPLIATQWWEEDMHDVGVVEGAVPDWASFHPRHVVLQQFTHANNFGHRIGDVYMTAFMMQMAVGRDPSADIQLLSAFGDHRTNKPLSERDAEFARLVTNHAPSSLQALAGAADRNVICFSELITGKVGFHILHSPMLSMVIADWVEFSLRNVGLWPYPPLRTHLIIVNHKVGGQARAFLNAQDAFDAIRSRYLGKGGVDVRIVDFSTMTMREQISLVMQCTLFVTPPGGASYIGMYMPPGAALLMFDVLDANLSPPRSHRHAQDGNMWSQHPWIHDFYYTVTRDEVVEAPGVHCLNALDGGSRSDYKIDTTRLVQAVDKALRATRVQIQSS